MTYLKCDKCGGYYELQEGESADDFEGCECGGCYVEVENPDVASKEIEEKAKFCKNCGAKNTDNSKYCEECGQSLQKVINKQTNETKETKANESIKTNNRWMKRGAGALIGIFGILIVTVVIIGAITGHLSTSTGPTADQIEQQAVTVTAAQLYSDNGNLVGKPVKMKGELIQTGSNTIRVKGINMSDGYNFDDQDIVVTGNFASVTAYEHAEVWVYGIYNGPVTYKTMLGSERTVPSITNAWIEPTGNTFK